MSRYVFRLCMPGVDVCVSVLPMLPTTTENSDRPSFQNR